MEKIEAKDVNFYYGSFHALKGISMEIPQNKVVAFIGPSGCGKSTFLRLFNRMNDLIPGARLEGEICIDGKNIYAPGVQVDELRKEVGMVFQRPNPFPKSIFDNVAYGLRVNGIKDKSFIAHRVEEAAALWDEVKDKLNASAYALSGGQQQRLCIARAMAVSPSVLLMDEPASALDPISTAKVEELICELRNEVTIVGFQGERQDGFLLYGGDGRIRRYQGDIHQPPQGGYPELHHRKVRLTGREYIPRDFPPYLPIRKGQFGFLLLTSSKTIQYHGEIRRVRACPAQT